MEKKEESLVGDLQPRNDHGKEELLVGDLHPTNDHGKDKIQSTHLEVWIPSQTYGSSKEDEAIFTGSLKPYEDIDKQESTQFSDSSYMQGMTTHIEIDFPCFVHMTTLEEYLLRSYGAFHLRELIIETKRLPNKKVLQFNNIGLSWVLYHGVVWRQIK